MPHRVFHAAVCRTDRREPVLQDLQREPRDVPRVRRGLDLFSRAVRVEPRARRAVSLRRAVEAAIVAGPKPHEGARAGRCPRHPRGARRGKRVRRLVRRPHRRRPAAHRRPHQRVPAAAGVARAREADQGASAGHVCRDGRRELRSDDGHRDRAAVSVRRRRRVRRGGPCLRRAGRAHRGRRADRRCARRPDAAPRQSHARVDSGAGRAADRRPRLPARIPTTATSSISSSGAASGRTGSRASSSKRRAAAGGANGCTARSAGSTARR